MKHPSENQRYGFAGDTYDLHLRITIISPINHSHYVLQTKRQTTCQNPINTELANDGEDRQILVRRQYCYLAVVANSGSF